MVAILSGLLSAGCSVFGIRTEQSPAYTVERTLGSGASLVELRRYGSRLAADVTVSGTESESRSSGFKVLSGYIFGANGDKASIDMTAPVAQARADARSIERTAPLTQAPAGKGQWRIRFFMPAKFTRETLPAPNDPSIAIVTVPPETVAALRYAGSVDPVSVHDAERRLLQTLRDAGLQSADAPFTWFYDPPWTLPPLRRNEAAVLVQLD